MDLKYTRYTLKLEIKATKKKHFIYAFLGHVSRVTYLNNFVFIGQCSGFICALISERSECFLLLCKKMDLTCYWAYESH